jgi:predicted alpha/beta superfamily hydrolase
MIRGALILLAVFLSACASSPPRPATSLEITAMVPEGTGALYISGNLDALGPWKADGQIMQGAARERRVKLSVPPGHTLEYKFTLGEWSREALGPSGMVMGNFKLAPGETTARHEIPDFKKDPRTYIADVAGAGIQGQLDYWPDAASKHLSETRHVSIWTPPGYAAANSKRYRVIYMSDGQNLFDPRIANTGIDWGADEAMVRLAADGVDPAIIVATWSTDKRGEEYSPWHGAPNYALFLIEELMPQINRTYRTKTGAENTFHAGSSMGGLLSYYLVTHHPETFGACGCVSTHFPLSEAIVAQYFQGITTSAVPDKTPYVLRDIDNGVRPPATARYGFDYGTEGLDAAYAPTHAAVRLWLVAAGKTDGRDFYVRAYPGADHSEKSWRARLDDIFRFMLTSPANEAAK